LVWSPTVAEVVLHYPDSERQTTRTRKVFVALTLPIHDIKKDVAQQAGLPHPHEIHLAGAPVGRAWPDGDTLEQHTIQTGSTVWVRIDQPRPAAVAPTPALALLVAMVIVVVGSVWLLVPKGRGSAVATTATALPSATHAPTARPAAYPTPAATPVRAADTQLRADYQAGVAAYDRQAWPEAAGFFKRVYALDPQYQDVTPLLAELHYHWAAQTLTSTDRVEESLAILRQTFVYSPTHTTARQLKQRLELYRDGRMQIARAEWQAAIATLTQLRALQPDFLDVSQRLYDAYLGSAQQLRDAGDATATHEQCTRAFELPVADTSASQSCLAELEQPATVAPAPPTQPPVVLVTVPDVRGADVGKARDFLRARGFRVAVTELARPADVGALCNGMVSYSSPPKGKRIPAGSLVRLYYRGYSRPNPAQCG
ncbi:MAG TPA: PASTA domain-containing protein, partial [Roseiflexaceae bacterium]|nr:PASTA domain-containing protein [Roseiflexaceae bacterium]